MGFARHPSWALKRLSKVALSLANFVDPAGKNGGLEVLEFDPSITWKDIREVADSWGGPFALKGVMSADDARRAADAGVTAVIVSNHGGRQFSWDRRGVGASRRYDLHLWRFGRYDRDQCGFIFRARQR